MYNCTVSTAQSSLRDPSHIFFFFFAETNSITNLLRVHGAPNPPFLRWDSFHVSALGPNSTFPDLQWFERREPVCVQH